MFFRCLRLGAEGYFRRPQHLQRQTATRPNAHTETQKACRRQRLRHTATATATATPTLSLALSLHVTPARTSTPRPLKPQHEGPNPQILSGNTPPFLNGDIPPTTFPPAESPPPPNFQLQPLPLTLSACDIALTDGMLPRVGTMRQHHGQKCVDPPTRGGGGDFVALYFRVGNFAFQIDREISLAKFRVLREFLAHRQYTLWTVAGGHTQNPGGSAKFTTVNLTWRKIPPASVFSGHGMQRTGGSAPKQHRAVEWTAAVILF